MLSLAFLKNKKKNMKILSAAFVIGTLRATLQKLFALSKFYFFLMKCLMKLTSELKIESFTNIIKGKVVFFFRLWVWTSRRFDTKAYITIFDLLTHIMHLGFSKILGKLVIKYEMYLPILKVHLKKRDQWRTYQMMLIHCCGYSFELHQKNIMSF